jgi:UDP-N-acetylglucosamine--N-acetylmuramyl-(pentapeptide) pyrophosphoryl-undecaprenol N-acetylglucosamine transferase
LLLVTGGSQGARHLNQVVCRTLPDLLPYCQVLQISGKLLLQETRELSEQAMSELDAGMRQRYRLVPYLNEEMPVALQAAELVLCRSGAATLSELAVLSKPSLLVPLPPAIGSSPQEANAGMFARSGAAQVIKDTDLKRELLVDRVKSIFTSNTLLQSMAEAVRTFARPDATQDIVAEVRRIASTKSAKTHGQKHEVVSI